MAIKATYYGNMLPRQNNYDTVEAPGAQSGDAISVANGAVSSAVASTGIYRIKATSACTIRIGTSLANASGGEPWAIEEKEYRYIVAGEVIACDAP